MTGFAVRIGVLGVLVVLGAAACTAPATRPVGAQSAATIELRGSVPSEQVALPDATFTDTAGRPFRLRAAAKGSTVTVVFFGYTHCPEVCSTVVADLAQALRRVGPEVRRHVRVLFVTVDPERDEPSTLRRYLDRFDPAFVGLVGSDTTLRDVTGALGVALTGRRDTGEGYEIGHGAQLIGFDAAQQRRVIWPEGTPVGDLEEDIRTLVQEAK
ncbi:SCO family protein [Flindersiella endophytica]